MNAQCEEGKMKVFKKIMVACDLSTYSFQTIKHAAELAESLKAELVHRQCRQPAGCYGRERGHGQNSGDQRRFLYITGRIR